jgi:hypothetical protein
VRLPDAGWSSLVARWAHNPKVEGSNPSPATNKIKELGEPLNSLFLQVAEKSLFWLNIHAKMKPALVTHLSFKGLKMIRMHLGYSHATPENPAVEFL